nr:MAG TPA: hypothetical protein [Caudoviricetes sp.]
MISSARLSILVILSCLSGFCSKFQIVLVQIIRCNTGDVVCDIPKQDSVASYRRHPVSTLPNEEFQRLCFFGHTSVRMLRRSFQSHFCPAGKGFVPHSGVIADFIGNDTILQKGDSLIECSNFHYITPSRCANSMARSVNVSLEKSAVLRFS